MCLYCACSEFMVEEHELQKEKIQEDYNDKYWDQRYTIVQHRIPSFLQKMADKILSTGKYETKKNFNNKSDILDLGRFFFFFAAFIL